MIDMRSIAANIAWVLLTGWFVCGSTILQLLGVRDLTKLSSWRLFLRVVFSFAWSVWLMYLLISLTNSLY